MLQKVEKVSASASSHAWRRPDVNCASCASVADGAERCMGTTHGLGRRLGMKRASNDSCHHHADGELVSVAVVKPEVFLRTASAVR